MSSILATTDADAPPPRIQHRGWEDFPFSVAMKGDLWLTDIVCNNSLCMPVMIHNYIYMIWQLTFVIYVSKLQIAVSQNDFLWPNLSSYRIWRPVDESKYILWCRILYFIIFYVMLLGYFFLYIEFGWDNSPIVSCTRGNCWYKPTWNNRALILPKLNI